MVLGASFRQTNFRERLSDDDGDGASVVLPHGALFGLRGKGKGEYGVALPEGGLHVPDESGLRMPVGNVPQAVKRDLIAQGFGKHPSLCGKPCAFSRNMQHHGVFSDVERRPGFFIFSGGTEASETASLTVDAVFSFTAASAEAGVAGAAFACTAAI